MNQSAVPAVSPATLEVVALGGLGEFGMNMMAVSWQDTTVLIDAGVMFPDPDQLGGDLIIPDMAYVDAPRGQVKAPILPHGHEDQHAPRPHTAPRRQLRKPSRPDGLRPFPRPDRAGTTGE